VRQTAAKNEKKSRSPDRRDTALKIKTALAEAHAADPNQIHRRTLAFEQVLAIILVNPKPSPENRRYWTTPEGPQELDSDLTAGIRSYYQSSLRKQTIRSPFT